MSAKESRVSTVSDLTPVPMKLTVKDDLVTLYLHHLMVSEDASSQEFCWKDEPLQDHSKPCSAQQMSKALHLLIPYPVFCASKVERVFLYQRNIQPSILDALPGLTQNSVTFQTYLSGSKGENFDIPLTFSLDGKLNITSVSKSDLDLLFVMPMQPQEANRMVVETENTHPGYFRCLGKEAILACGVSEFAFKQSQLVGQMHGPSVLANTPMKQVDHVLAFQYHGWPREAADFNLRKHPSGWPSEDMVKEIVDDGCHMVLKSHPFTDKNVKNEFRYSFSLAEKRLAASLTTSQRFVFMYLKLIHQEYFNCRDEISSYHLKTILFWECGEVPPENWMSGNEALRLLSILDRLLRCLEERNLPSFFIPDNNLIEHIPTERIEHLQTQVMDIRENLIPYIMGFLKKKRFLGYPLSLGGDMIEGIGKFAMATAVSQTETDMVKTHVDLAVQCAALHVSEFYLCEKMVMDTTQYFLQPGEGTLAAQLIKCYMRNIFLPVKSALYILQQAWPKDKPGYARCPDVNFDTCPDKPEALPQSEPGGNGVTTSDGELRFKATTKSEIKKRDENHGCTNSKQQDNLTSEQEEEILVSACYTRSKHKTTGGDSDHSISECLKKLGECVSSEGLSMVEDKKTEDLIQQFLDHELPGLVTARQQLETLLEVDAISICIDPNDPSKSKLWTAWSVLLHLVAYCFIIMKSKNKCIAEKYLQRIQDLQGKLTQVVGLEDLSYCCEQLYAFSLLSLGHDDKVEEILLSSKLKPIAAVWLRKLISAKQESEQIHLPSSKWAWECVSLTKYGAHSDEGKSTYIKKWLEHQPSRQKDLSSGQNHPDSNPVGQLYGTHDRTYWDSCMMRWELDTAQNMLVPKENLLCQSLQSMVEDLLTANKGTGTALDSMHPCCTLIVAKYLLLIKDTDKGIILLEQILGHQSSVVDHYRLFPLEVRLMLDDRVLARRNLRIQDHFDFSILMYALYLSVRAYLEKEDLSAAQSKVDEMMQLCDRDLRGQLGCSYPQQVSANNLTLLGTAQNMCGNKAGSLMAFICSELLSQTSITQCPLSLKMEGKTCTEAVKEGIRVVSSQLKVSSPEAFGIYLGVLYPEADLSTALDRLVTYCTEDGSLHEEYMHLYGIMSDLSDYQPSKYCKVV